jgi:tetratricopeptide (TPR) repeat protein
MMTGLASDGHAGAFGRPQPAIHIGSKVLAVLVAAAALAVLTCATLELRAGTELDKARALLSEGDYTAAHRHYFQALNWYAPWGSSQAAADELMDLCQGHIAAGRRSEALQGLLRLRSGLMAARSFYQPRRDLLERANPLIALSLASLKLGDSAPRDQILSQAAIYQALYAADPSDRQPWLFMVVFSFLLWAGAAFHLVFTCFKDRGPLDPALKRRAVLIPLAVFVYGYLMWVFSMNMP